MALLNAPKFTSSLVTTTLRARIFAALAFSILIPFTSMAGTENGAPEWKLKSFSIDPYTCEKPLFFEIENLDPATAAGRYSVLSKENKCLEHKTGALVIIEISPGETAPKSARIIRKKIETVGVNISNMVNPTEEYPALVKRYKEQGYEPLLRSSGVLQDERVYFAKVASDFTIPLACQKFVTTVAGFRNPLGTRTLECKGQDGYNASFTFEDEAY